MCDWEAEEYAEYLLWLEAEKACIRTRPRSASEETQANAWLLAEIPREMAEA